MVPGWLLLVAATAGFLGCGTPTPKGTSQPSASGDTAPGDTVTENTGTVDTAPPADADGDGWPSAVDCDDTDLNIYPGAVETCDGVDQDCDGIVDDNAVDASTWYADDDGDGYGDATSTTAACAAPDGYGADDRDCDDTDATIHPGADETCDGVDQDCDDTIDEDAIDALTWNADTDGDGYGSATDTTRACDVPDGYLDDAQDCDDTDPDAHPGAYDLCNDDLDQDCDGTERSCPYSGVESAESAAYASLVGEGDDDGAGDLHGMAIVPDMDGDGYDELLVGAEDVSTVSTGAGAAYILYGPPSPGQTSLADADATFYEEAAYAFAGSAVAPLGDVTGDGVTDFGIGAPYSDAAGDMSGSFYVFEGGSYAGSVALSTATTSIDGTGDDELLGSMAVGVGDIDGDGVDDMALSAPHDVALTGAVYVFFGPVPTGSVSASAADLTILGPEADDRLGVGLAAAGDTNADGYDDILASGLGDEIRGRAYLFTDLSGTTSDTIEAGDATASFEGEDPSDEVAHISGPSDINGDGEPDVVIGADSYGASGFLGGYGRVYVFLAPIDDGSHADADADVIITGDTRGDSLGQFTAAPGDINGDGADDLLVGGYGYGYGGFASVFFGPIYAGTRLGGSAGATFYQGYMDGFGYQGVGGGGGDADGDGYPDFLVAAPLASDGARNSGTVYFFRGGP